MGKIDSFQSFLHNFLMQESLSFVLFQIFRSFHIGDDVAHLSGRQLGGRYPLKLSLVFLLTKARRFDSFLLDQFFHKS